MNEKLAGLWATKNKDDEWWSSFVTSPIAIVFNYLVVDLKFLTPNLVTLLSFIVAIVSAVLIILGGTVNFMIAAVLIHLSHVLDCMDGQMARYRKTASMSGSYFDRLTDQIQVTLWFGAVGYAAYLQSNDILPVLLAFVGVSFYGLRGYSKYTAIHTEMTINNNYLNEVSEAKARNEDIDSAGPAFSVFENIKWFIFEQRKILAFDEGVFIFMLSLALIFNEFTLMLWLFAISQVFYGLLRGWQRGMQLGKTPKIIIGK